MTLQHVLLEIKYDFYLQSFDLIIIKWPLKKFYAGTNPSLWFMLRRNKLQLAWQSTVGRQAHLGSSPFQCLQVVFFRIILNAEGHYKITGTAIVYKTTGSLGSLVGFWKLLDINLQSTRNNMLFLIPKGQKMIYNTERLNFSPVGTSQYL